MSWFLTKSEKAIQWKNRAFTNGTRTIGHPLWGMGNEPWSKAYTL